MRRWLGDLVVLVIFIGPLVLLGCLFAVADAGQPHSVLVAWQRQRFIEVYDGASWGYSRTLTSGGDYQFGDEFYWPQPDYTDCTTLVPGCEREAARREVLTWRQGYTTETVAVYTRCIAINDAPLPVWDLLRPPLPGQPVCQDAS